MATRSTSLGKTLQSVPYSTWAICATFALIAGALGALAYYGKEREMALAMRISSLEQQLASTTALLSATIDETHSSLAEALAAEAARVASVQNQLGGVETRVGSLSGSVDTLNKLTTTDKELLAKYSKIFFLSENYAPARLAEIPEEYRYYENRTTQVIPEMLPRLLKMLADAQASGIELYIYSAYRSFDTQEALKGQYVVTYGAGTANQFSADQGYSEHQLGTTVDIITTGLGGQLTEKFGETSAFVWLTQNAHRYGFVLSYPKGNAYYEYEPWHWRFVGVRLATDLHNSGKNFYDLDQREIDEYLVSLFD